VALSVSRRQNSSFDVRVCGQCLPCKLGTSSSFMECSRTGSGTLPHVDTIAERATILGETALGAARMAASASRIEEYPPSAVDETGHLEALADRCGSLADALRQAINEAAGLDDADTADLFTEMSRTVDKALWYRNASSGLTRPPVMST